MGRPVNWTFHPEKRLSLPSNTSRKFGRSVPGWLPKDHLPQSTQRGRAASKRIGPALGYSRTIKIPPAPLCKGGLGGFRRPLSKLDFLNKISRFYTLVVQRTLRPGRSSKPQARIPPLAGLYITTLIGAGHVIAAKVGIQKSRRRRDGFPRIKYGASLSSPE